MQTFLNKYGIYLVVVLFALVALVIWINAKRASSGTGRSNMGFFIDEETGEESVRSLSELPPLMGKSGRPTVVRAMKYGFADNSDKRSDERTVYLTKFTPEVQEALKTLPENDPKRPELFFSGQLVRSPQPDSKWILLNNPASQAITVLPNPPAGKRIVLISPK
ncbi:MAG: hypothetical protein FWD61_00150 [Phycisphaerales bacterium]|nr:hypothetical protein [Phycisphaerales bacterium]